MIIPVQMLMYHSVAQHEKDSKIPYLESKNAGLYSNLFYYNEQTGELEFISAGQIDSDGNVEFDEAEFAR